MNFSFVNLLSYLLPSVLLLLFGKYILYRFIEFLKEEKVIQGTQATVYHTGVTVFLVVLFVGVVLTGITTYGPKTVVNSNQSEYILPESKGTRDLGPKMEELKVEPYNSEK